MGRTSWRHRFAMDRSPRAHVPAVLLVREAERPAPGLVAQLSLTVEHGRIAAMPALGIAETSAGSPATTISRASPQPEGSLANQPVAAPKLKDTWRRSS